MCGDVLIKSWQEGAKDYGSDGAVVGNFQPHLISSLASGYRVTHANKVSVNYPPARTASIHLNHLLAVCPFLPRHRLHPKSRNMQGGPVLIVRDAGGADILFQQKLHQLSFALLCRDEQSRATIVVSQSRVGLMLQQHRSLTRLFSQAGCSRNSRSYWQFLHV